MDAPTAVLAINAILDTCDDRTRSDVMKHILPQPVPKRAVKRKLTVLQAKEDLLQNYFRQ